jgi:hypothetical protein
MTAFDDLPLVIEPADLASRLNEPHLILVDLTACNQPSPIWSNCSASWAITQKRFTLSMTTRVAAGRDASSGCWM